MAALVFVLLLLTLAIQVTLILRYTFAADALEAEAQAIATPGPVRRTSFTAAAGALFNSVQSTPNVELTGLEYRPDGGLIAIVEADSAAVLTALRQRAEANGLDVSLGPLRGAGGRQAADLMVAP
jgi:general secretion pathway protein L